MFNKRYEDLDDPLRPEVASLPSIEHRKGIELVERSSAHVSEGNVSYAAVELKIGILELFAAAQHSGFRRRGREFFENATIIKRTEAPQPRCDICGSLALAHNCPGIRRVAVSFPPPVCRAREEKKRFNFSNVPTAQLREFQLRAWDIRGRRCSPDQIERAIALRAEGKSRAAIALMLGIPCSTLKKALKRAGGF